MQRGRRGDMHLAVWRAARAAREPSIFLPLNCDVPTLPGRLDRLQPPTELPASPQAALRLVLRDRPLARAQRPRCQACGWVLQT